MRHQNFAPKKLKKIIAVFLACSLITGFVACNGNKKEGDKKSSSETATAVTFKMNCVRLERSQIQTWVDSGWTNPANSGTFMTKILLQFYSADGSNANNNMQLMAFPGKTYTNVYSGGKAFLQIDTTCTALTLSGPVSLSNNYIIFSSLGIIKGDGTLNDFDFIRLRPVKNYPPYVNFEIEIVKVAAQGETTMAKGGTDPCPTICPATE